MINKNGTLFDQGFSCVTLLVLGICGSPFIPEKLRHSLEPLLILLLFFLIVVDRYRQSKRRKEDIQREQRDERNQMILERAVWHCRQAEDLILLGLYAIFTLGLHQYETANVLIWILVGRNLLTFGIRWWLNRIY